jgi:hypothetical protein
MDAVVTSSYAPPLDQLLRLGDCRRRSRPPYGVMGFGPEHVSELIRMSADPALLWAKSDSAEVWAPVHAWRVLGELRAAEAVEPLLELMERQEAADDDWVGSELPVVFGVIGAPAVAPLARFLADRSRRMWSRVFAASGLEKIGLEHPEARSECVAALTRVLEGAAEEDPELNGCVIAELMDLNALEAAPVMERAFAEGLVDLSVAGDWEDVQVEMGLLPQRITPARNYLYESLERVDTERTARTEPSPQAKVAAQRAAAKRAAAKRKAAKAVRKNRRRR